MARVLLLAPRALFREPLAFLLAREPGVAEVAQAASAADAHRLLAAGLAPDVAVVDLPHSHPGADTERLLCDLASGPTPTSVLALTGGQPASDAASVNALPPTATLDAVMAAVRGLVAAADPAPAAPAGLAPPVAAAG